MSETSVLDPWKHLADRFGGIAGGLLPPVGSRLIVSDKDGRKDDQIRICGDQSSRTAFSLLAIEAGRLLFPSASDPEREWLTRLPWKPAPVQFEEGQVDSVALRIDDVAEASKSLCLETALQIAREAAFASARSEQRAENIRAQSAAKANIVASGHGAEFWKQLAADFRGLEDADRLVAMRATRWYLEDGPAGKADRERLHRRFTALAERGGGTLDQWLDFLSAHPFYQETESLANIDGAEVAGLGGWIQRLATASADVCVELETQAIREKNSNHEQPPSEVLPTTTASQDDVLDQKFGDWLREKCQNSRKETTCVSANTLRKAIAGKWVSDDALGKLRVHFKKHGVTMPNPNYSGKPNPASSLAKAQKAQKAQK